MRTKEKGLNIDVTRGQYMMLYNIMCEHNQMVNPEANMVDNCLVKKTSVDKGTLFFIFSIDRVNLSRNGPRKSKDVSRSLILIIINQNKISLERLIRNSQLQLILF